MESVAIKTIPCTIFGILVNKKNTMNLNSVDHEYNNLQINKVLAVPGRAVIQDLYVKNLYQAQAPLLLTASASSSSSQWLPLTATGTTATATANTPRYAALDVMTNCIIPLGMAGTGSWLNLQKCAHFEVECQGSGGGAENLVTVSPDKNYLCFLETGLYKCELNLKIGHTGHGMHSIAVGLGINETPPKRAMASCLSFGGSGDLCGVATGTALLRIETLPACVDIFLRDETIPATDANIFQGTLFLTYLGPPNKY